MAKKKAGGKKGGGKKGGKKVDFETSDAALCPFGVGPRDIIRTPLGTGVRPLPSRARRDAGWLTRRRAGVSNRALS